MSNNNNMASIGERFSLQGRVAVVTGSGTGLGAHFAHVLAEAGASVACVARRVEKVEAVAQSIRDAGGKAFACAMDVTDKASINKAFSEIEANLGVVDVLVNNAGLANHALFEDMTEEQWTSLLDANLSGPFYVAQKMATRLIELKQGGNIINITSILAHLAKSMLLNYGTTKGALVNLTQAMALDLMPHGIRVNAIAPGYFPSEMTNPYYESEIGLAEIANLPIKRLGRHEELDGALLLLASHASSYMSGSVVTVDAAHSVRLS